MNDSSSTTSAAINTLREHINSRLIGQSNVVDQVLIAMLAGGHVLIEGVPGLGKTLLVQTLAAGIGGKFKRIQFTPDLMPGDVTGHVMFDMSQSKFVLKQGPVFTNLLLADEINRAPAKTQAALLEVMQEYQVTLDGKSLEVGKPFMVLATQNPIEQEGTYPLAEAQVDRFMMKLKLDYPSRTEEQEILDRMLVDTEHDVRPVLGIERLLALRQVSDNVYLDNKIRAYVLDIVTATRDPESAGVGDLQHLISFGASPRASLFLARAAKALALVRGRGFVIPEDVKEVAPDVLRHRLVPTYEAEAEEISTDDLVQRLLEQIEVP